MNIRLAAPAAAILCVWASCASAETITAKLLTPISAPKTVVAGGAIFTCQADACVAGYPAGNTLSRSGCVQLTKAVGAVASYGAETRKLDDTQLTACNAVAKK